MSNNLFFGGVPTEPDVKKLLEAWPLEQLNRDRGKVITHKEIARVIEEAVRSNRYRTVVTAWRKHLETNADVSLRIVAERSVGYRVLHEHERTDHGLRDAKTATRGLKRAAVRVNMVDVTKLDDAQTKRHDHIARGLAVASSHIDGSLKKIRAELKGVVALPHRRES